jgi:hypothetical protein
MAVLVDGFHSDDSPRVSLYDGDIHVSPPTAVTEAHCEFGRELVREAFGALDPELAQDPPFLSRYGVTG